jgi:hypothetical protein
LWTLIKWEHLKSRERGVNMKNSAILAVVGSVMLFVAVDAACVSHMVSTATHMCAMCLAIAAVAYSV